MDQQINLRALLVDRLMGKLIPAGALFGVACVCAILVFLGVVATPLFLSSSANLQGASRQVSASSVAAIENGHGFWWIGPRGIHAREGRAEAVELGLKTPIQAPIAVAPVSGTSLLATLDARGGLQFVRVQRNPAGDLGASVVASMDISPKPADLMVCARDESSNPRLVRIRAGKATVGGPGGLGDPVETELGTEGVTAAALSSQGTLAALGNSRGQIEIWNVEDAAEPKRLQIVSGPETPVAVMTFLIGDETLITAWQDGSVRGYFRVRHVTLENTTDRAQTLKGDVIPPRGSIVVPDKDHAHSAKPGGPVKVGPGGMPWMMTRAFPKLPSAPVALAASPRNKTFAFACPDGSVHAFYATTERRLFSARGDASAGRPSQLAWSHRADRLCSGGESVQTWEVSNPHPDVTLHGLTLPLWYEGYAEPEIVWQSSSGTQETEPKYSLFPLVFGTLKGTLYALVFSVPIAIFAAIYVSRFAPSRLRTVVKPAVEIMASIPSVVVGMIAALWLAPLLERALFPALVALVFFPLVFAAANAVAARQSRRPDARPRPGAELMAAAAVLCGTVLLAALAGPTLEGALFSQGLRQWLYDTLGVNYDLRNGFVVGIAMGFAVIPIMFTISEDALSGVPPSLSNAAVALGATRWQTVRHVVLPAAASGLFAAVVLGLGRAAGETMIVVMAAGNTPILDPSPWNGMRTMSAAMAIEIPEAPHGGSLYRVLFLTGLLLFAFTAVLNTAAELVGSRMRRKYGRF